MGSPEPILLGQLSQKGDDSLGAIFVDFGKIDLIAEDNEPFIELFWPENDTGVGLLVLAVLIEGFEEELGGG